jgi:hypothetical protein
LRSGGERQGPNGPCAGDSKGRACQRGPLRIGQLPPLRGGLVHRAQRGVRQNLTSNPTSASPSASSCHFKNQNQLSRCSLIIFDCAFPVIPPSLPSTHPILTRTDSVSVGANLEPATPRRKLSASSCSNQPSLNMHILAKDDLQKSVWINQAKTQ